MSNAVPTVLQDSPAAFDPVVLAVIRRVVGQFQRQLVAVGELDQTFHELRAGTADLRAVVQVDQQPIHAGMCGAAMIPPQFQAIRHEVAGVAGRSENHVQLVVVHFQDAGRREQRIGMHIVVGGTDGLASAGHAAPRKRADLYLGLGVDRDAERGGFVRGLGVNVLQMPEDGVGFGDFF